ncbi:MAG: hypothetical protein ACXWBN_20430, partial [Acidimicrobiales bacterium]
MTKPVATLVALLLAGAVACSGCAKSSKVEPTASPLGSVSGAPAGDATTTAPAGSSGPATTTAPASEPAFVGKGAAFCTAIKDLVSGVQTDLTQTKASADNMHHQADAIRANAPAEIEQSADAYA